MAGTMAVYAAAAVAVGAVKKGYDTIKEDFVDKPQAQAEALQAKAQASQDAMIQRARDQQATDLANQRNQATQLVQASQTAQRRTSSGDSTILTGPLRRGEAAFGSQSGPANKTLLGQ